MLPNFIISRKLFLTNKCFNPSIFTHFHRFYLKDRTRYHSHNSCGNVNLLGLQWVVWWRFWEGFYLLCRIPELEKNLHSLFRDISVSRHNGRLIKGPFQTPQYSSAVMVLGLSRKPNGAQEGLQLGSPICLIAVVFSVLQYPVTPPTKYYVMLGTFYIFSIYQFQGWSVFA